MNKDRLNPIQRLFENTMPAKVVMFIYLGISLTGVFVPTWLPYWLRSFFLSFLLALAISQITQFIALAFMIFTYSRLQKFPNRQYQFLESLGPRGSMDHFALLGMISVIGYTIWLAIMGRDLYAIGGSLLSVGFFIELRFRSGRLKDDKFIFRELLYSGLAALISGFIAHIVNSNSPDPVQNAAWPFIASALYFAFRIFWIQYWQVKWKIQDLKETSWS